MENPKNMMIRDFQEKDYQQLMYLWEETSLSTPKRGDDLEVILRTLKLGGKLILLEDSQQKLIIGSSWLTQDGRRIYLHHFGILPDYQGKGLSKLLLQESLKFAKEKKMQIKLEVHKEHEKTIRLYSNAGFSYLGDYLVYIIRDVDGIES
jgi:ribosomal-protein-alanine N-acetyltransferase